MPAQQDGSVTGHAGAAEQVDTVIIGAGQAGLAAGYYLKRLGRSLVILDEHERTGELWRERYGSLRLYTPAKYDGLPGMKFPAAPYSFPSGRQMGDFLERYAARMQLPVRTGCRADGVWPSGRGQPGYLVTAGPRRFEAAQVIVATGGQQNPSVPGFAGELDPGIRQLHSSEYRDPLQLQPGPVLVVGASHSGADIALEVSAGHRTWLSGRVKGQLPFDLEGRPARQIMKIMWFAANHVLTMQTPMGRRLRPQIREHGGPLLRVKLPQLHDAGVQYQSSRVALVRDGKPVLDDGRILDVANVIWCTGFRPDFSWIHLPVTGPDGWPQQWRGIVGSAPGLYFLGLLFQYAFGSMLVGGVARDAKYVARHIAARQPWAAPASPALTDAVPAQHSPSDQPRASQAS
ncbi:MAG TPA: NAD(P)-binding domain-containing protein [Streptosporangiaceae bacterium]|jgi:putative flavoprotein involved in K+ transport